MSNSPIVSILLPVYKGEQTLKRTLESLLNQSYKNFELLIGIDGSKDQSKTIALSFKDPRITIIEHPINLGLANNLNALIEKSHPESKYLAIAEQDDWYVPDRIKWQVEVLNDNADVGMVSGIAEFKSDKRSVLFPGLLVNGHQFEQGEKLFKFLYVNQLKVVNTCLMWRKEVQKAHHLKFKDTYGNFNVDWNFILRFCLISHVYGIPKKLVVMDRTSKNKSVTKDKFAQNRASFNLLRDFKEEFHTTIDTKTFKEAIKYNQLLNLGLQPKSKLMAKSVYLSMRYWDTKYLIYAFKRLKKYMSQKL